MEDYKPINTAMVAGCNLRKEDESKEANQTMYRSMIWSLLYVTTSRLDIMQTIGLVGRFQVEPKETYVLTVKRIFIYFKGTLDFGLWYPTRKEFTLKTCIDANWEANVDDKKNTNSRVLFLGNSIVSWFSKKSSISLSTTEEEYIAATIWCTRVL